VGRSFSRAGDITSVRDTGADSGEFQARVDSSTSVTAIIDFFVLLRNLKIVDKLFTLSHFQKLSFLVAIERLD
jgi:hypothetical protein